MRIPLAILLVFLISGGFIDSIEVKLKLKLLHVLFRHGDKVPVRKTQSYRTDPHRNHSYYPVDDGDLTNRGKDRVYTFGTMLRKNYHEFLGPYYSKTLVYARSTEVPRTQMSLQGVLAGLFPPSGQQTWNSKILWQPAYMQYTPRDLDGLLFSQRCEKFRAAHKQLLKDDSTVKAMVKRFDEPMKILSDHTNLTVNSTLQMVHLYNLFKEQEAERLSLPPWIRNIYPFPMRYALKADFDILSFNNELKRLNAGPLLRRITEDMKASKNGSLEPDGRKVFLYAGHEVNVAAMARTLNLTSLAIPEYSSAIIFETLQDEKNNYYIKVRVWDANKYDPTIKNQTLPNCDHPCPLEKFLEIYKDVIPTEAEADCWANHKKNHKYQKNSITSRYWHAIRKEFNFLHNH